jgi:hypothetical protein
MIVDRIREASVRVPCVEGLLTPRECGGFCWMYEGVDGVGR